MRVVGDVEHEGRLAGNDLESSRQLDPGEAGEYSVRVANAVGVTASPEARLTVRRPPTVSIFTATPNVVEGRNLIIDGFPDGDAPLRFQWRFNGADLVGQPQKSRGELRWTPPGLFTLGDIRTETAASTIFWH